MCKFFLAGACSKDTQCPYSHDTTTYPCRFYHLEGNCGHGKECRFSHEALSNHSYQEFALDNKDYVLKLHKDNKLSLKAVETIEFIRA